MANLNRIFILHFSNIRSFLLGLAIYFIFIDSGGILGLRNFSFLILSIFTIRSFYYNSINLKVLIIILLTILIFVLAILFSLINNIEMYKIYPWVIFLLGVYFFYKTFLIFDEKEFINGLLFGGFLFAISIVLVYLILITNIPISDHELLLLLNTSFKGFFYQYTKFGFTFYMIYFQSTLLLSVIAVISYLNNNYKSYILFLFILLVSMSRFGLFTALLVPILVKIFGLKELSKKITIYFLPFVSILFICYFIIYFLFYDNLSVDIYNGITSSESRIISLVSTINSFSINNFFIGQGAGSEFYNMTIDGYSNNTELSQLEFLRKHGFIIFVFFHLLINLILYLNYKKGLQKVNIYVGTLYLVSLSNPVLTSLVFSILCGYSLSQIQQKEKNV